MENNPLSMEDECRKEFEGKCKFMRVGWSLTWDKAGFYAQLETDRAYTWFKLGWERSVSVSSTNHEKTFDKLAQIRKLVEKELDASGLDLADEPLTEVVQLISRKVFPDHVKN